MSLLNDIIEKAKELKTEVTPFIKDLSKEVKPMIKSLKKQATPIVKDLKKKGKVQLKKIEKIAKREYKDAVKKGKVVLKDVSEDIVNFGSDVISDIKGDTNTKVVTKKTKITKKAPVKRVVSKKKVEKVIPIETQIEKFIEKEIVKNNTLNILEKVKKEFGSDKKIVQFVRVFFTKVNKGTNLTKIEENVKTVIDTLNLKYVRWNLVTKK